MDRRQAGRKGGLIGGKAKNPKKGFGSATPEQRREWARKAHEARRRNRETQQEND